MPDCPGQSGIYAHKMDSRPGIIIYATSHDDSICTENTRDSLEMSLYSRMNVYVLTCDVYISKREREGEREREREREV